MKPFFSIITCTYNSEKYLKEALDSCISQTFRQFEHIFVDGYSSDSTVNIIKEYINKSKGINCKFIQKEAKGVANAMNEGIKNSDGKVLHFLHYDDYFYGPKTLETVHRVFLENPHFKWLISNKILKYDRFSLKIRNNYILKKYGVKIYKSIANWIGHASTFTNKELFDEYGYFNESYKIAMDNEFYSRIIHNNLPLITNYNLVVFRRHSSNLSHSIKSFSTIREEDMKVKKTLKLKSVV